MSDGVATRVAAARTLDEVLHRGRSLKAALGASLPGLADPRDRALVEAMVLAALRQRLRYNAALDGWTPLAASHDLREAIIAGAPVARPSRLAGWIARAGWGAGLARARSDMSDQNSTAASPNHFLIIVLSEPSAFT